MSFVSGLFSGAKGANFQGQGQSSGQLGTDTTQAEGVQGQQQAFLSQLAAQGGAQNQSNVFQQQQQLSNQLQQQANGQGPNPALAQLQQTTGQNVANQAALAAGQRGAGANAGLIARQVGQQGAATQQQAVGQGATQAANQQIAAEGALGTQQANMANLATQQVGQQSSTLQNLAGNAQGLQSNDINSLNNQNSANSAIAVQNQKTQGNILGGVTNGVAGALGLAEGGVVPDASPLATPIAPATVQDPNAPQSSTAKALAAKKAGPAAAPAQEEEKDPLTQAATGVGDLVGQGVSAIGSGIGSLFAEGGKVPAMVSPGEVYIPPSKVKEAQMSKDPTKVGEKIPGKAKVKGNSYANDTVPKTLEEGGIVLPKSVMEHKHPAWAAHAFVTAITAKTKLRKK